MTPAKTVTIKRFGPSGSSIHKNIVREHTRDVIPKINSETFFDLKYIFSNYIFELLEADCMKQR